MLSEQDVLEMIDGVRSSKLSTPEKVRKLLMINRYLRRYHAKMRHGMRVLDHDAESHKDRLHVADSRFQSIRGLVKRAARDVIHEAKEPATVLSANAR